MARLKRLNSNFFFERSLAFPANMGIYYIHPIRGKSFICAFPAEHVSEFDTKNIDDEGYPRMPLPGWRTVLVKLMKGGFITEGQALALFGPPSRESKNWALFMGHRPAEVTDAL